MVERCATRTAPGPADRWGDASSAPARYDDRQVRAGGGRLRLLRRSVAAAITGAVLVACSPQPPPITDVGTAVHNQVGQVLLSNASVDKPPNQQYAPGDVARVRLVLFNEAPQPDVLTSISSPAAESVTITLDRDCNGEPEQVRELQLRANPLVNKPAVLGPSGLRVPYRIHMLVNRRLDVGGNVPVTFTFRNAGSVTIAVPVEPNTGVQYPDGQPACEPVA